MPEDESLEAGDKQKVDLEVNYDENYVDNDQMNLPGEDRHEPTPQFKTKKPKKIPKKILFVLGLVLFAVAIGFAVWRLVPSKNETPDSTQTEQTTEQAAQSNNSQGLGDVSLTEEYKSDFLRISFKHPSSWTVNEVNDAIIVKSPDFKYKQNNGMEKDGFFKIYIKKGATDSDGKYLGRGYAVAPSEKITYSEPATGQRTETFLTDFGLDTPDNFAYFVVQGNFDLKKGDTLGPNFAKEIDAYLITGGFSSSDQTENLATNIMSLSEYKTNEAYITAIEIIKTLKLK